MFEEFLKEVSPEEAANDIYDDFTRELGKMGVYNVQSLYSFLNKVQGAVPADKRPAEPTDFGLSAEMLSVYEDDDGVEDDPEPVLRIDFGDNTLYLPFATLFSLSVYYEPENVCGKLFFLENSETLTEQELNETFETIYLMNKDSIHESYELNIAKMGASSGNMFSCLQYHSKSSSIVIPMTFPMMIAMVQMPPADESDDQTSHTLH